MVTGTFKWPQPIEGLGSNIEAVDKLMLKVVGGSQLGQAAAELINAGGKRMRPALLLTAASLGDQPINENAIQAAAAIELVHLASLVHDDILDESPQRRQKPSAIAVQGPAFALLLGDFLLAKALSAAGDETIALLLAETIASMAEGEAAEVAEAKRPEPLSEAYFEIISKKSGRLFAAAGAGGAICARLPTKGVEALKLYGEGFGIAFQLIDDIQDSKITKSQKPQALAEIKLRNATAKQSLSQLRGPGALSLKQLPAAYLDWASPL